MNKTTFSKERANRALSFISSLKHTKGVWHGKNFKLLPWQEKIVSEIFGTIKPNGYRQYTQSYVEIPKKQGKSELAAAIALYLTCGDGEPGAEVYGCAANKQQASIVFDVAVGMVEQNKTLRKLCKITPSQNRIDFLPLKSFYQVLSSESPTKHGLNIHGVIFDELHAQPDRKLYDVMSFGAGDARKQPLFFTITTAGNDRHSICYEIHQKAQDLLAGRKKDPTFYPVIYGMKEDEDWADEAVWRRVNPSIDVTVDIDKLRTAYNSAKENTAEENLFRQLRLNQWVKQTIRWMPMDAWDKCAEHHIDIDDLKGRECYAGLDLSSTTDLTAVVLLFPPQDENEPYIVLPYFWLPEDTLKLRVKRDKVPYDIWKQKGWLFTTEGNCLDYSYVEEFLRNLNREYEIKELVFDGWNARHFVQKLEGFTAVEYSQSYKSMSPPTNELMRLVLNNQIAHGGNIPLRWMADNVYASQDSSGNIKLDKKKSTEKIDGMIALVMALARALIDKPTGSIYDVRGPLILGDDD